MAAMAARDIWKGGISFRLVNILERKKNIKVKTKPTSAVAKTIRGDGYGEL